MTDSRYLTALKVILLTGMAYFTLLPVIAAVPQLDFFFWKPFHQFYRRPTINQIQTTNTARKHANLPSYEMLLKLSGMNPSAGERGRPGKAVPEADPAMTDKPLVVEPKPSPGPHMQERALPSAPSASPVAPPSAPSSLGIQ